MTDCKNCKYTDEYCVSGDCTSQSPRNGSQNGDLTSQWRKGELPEGWYFVILNNGKVDIAKCSNLFINCGRKLKRNFAIDNVAEVIEPICYEKWQAVNQNMDSVMQTNQALCQKLTQLKELLKECKDVILDYNNWIMSASPKDSELMLRIDEVLK